MNLKKPNYKALFDNLTLPLLILDSDFNIVAANKARVEVTGMTIEQSFGRNIFDLFPDNPNDPDANGVQNLRDSLNRVLKTKCPDQMPLQKYDIPIPGAKTADFQERYWDPINIPILDENGNIEHIVHQVEDVTSRVLAERQRISQTATLNEEIEARKIVEESEARTKEIANKLPLIVWTARPDGSVDWYNDWWYNYLGHPRGTEWDDPDRQPMHPEDVVRTNKLWSEAYRSGKEFKMEQRFRRGSDGQYRWHLVRAVPLFDQFGKLKKYIGADTDIHDEKMLTQKLRQAREAAERANETKTAFLANMSHEIRTPLGAILGFSSLLKDDSLGVAEKDQYVDTIIRNGNSLTRLIDDILDLAKVEAGRLDIENVRFSLGDLTAEAVGLFKDRAREKDIYLSLDIESGTPKDICADPTRLRQILINLIGNAVKFTAKGGVHVSLRSEFLFDDNVKITIDVTDTGIGLTPVQKERLFQPFTQADNSTTRKFGGTGLGLALSQRLSRALSGEISILDCEYGKGCTFRLTFVADLSIKQPEETSQLENVAVDPIAFDGLRVLVVDDSPDNQFLISSLLQKRGADVDLASDGEEAYTKALLHPYDVILLDIQMPKMDGYQAKRALDDRGYDKPIIALTAHAMAEEREKTLAAGFAAHITKPLVSSDLFKVLARLAKITQPIS